MELADTAAHYFAVAVFFSKKKQYKNGIVSGGFPDRRAVPTGRRTCGAQINLKMWNNDKGYFCNIKN